MNFIQDSFKSTIHWLLQVYCITQKMYISEYVSKAFLEELTFLCREIIAACNVSKNAALPQVYFCHTLRTISKEFDHFQRPFLPVHFTKLLRIIQIHTCFISHMEDVDFWPNNSW